jgi:hypothetical protein
VRLLIPINLQVSEILKKAFAFSSSMGWFFIRWVCLLLASIFETFIRALYALLLQLSPQYWVTVVRAVNSTPQC